MAVQTWEEILAAAQLSADERKILDNIQQKVPEFKDGWLRQSDYSRRSAEIAARKAEYDTAVATAAKWDAWADEKVPIWNTLKEKGAVDDDGNLLFLTEREQLKQDLEKARLQAAAGGEVDPEELKKNVLEVIKANGGATKEEITALIASEAKRLSAETVENKYQEFETNFNQKTIPFVAGFSTAVAVEAMRYEKETGKDWTDDNAKEFFDLMAKENNFKPSEVGKIYLKPFRDARATEEEIERRAEAKARERGGMPGGGGEPYIPQGTGEGSLQRMLRESAVEEGDVESLVTAAAQKAAGELRAEGKR